MTHILRRQATGGTASKEYCTKQSCNTWARNHLINFNLISNDAEEGWRGVGLEGQKGWLISKALLYSCQGAASLM